MTRRWRGLAVVGGISIVALACASGGLRGMSRGVRGGGAGDRVMLGASAARVRPALDPTVVRRQVRTVSSASRLHEGPVVRGEATYYADMFEGRPTASGLPFHQREPYAAHRTFPFGTVLRVTNERNGRSVIVRVVDRGPWGSEANRRRTIIDLSRSVAERLGFVHAGRVPVRIEVLLVGAGA